MNSRRRVNSAVMRLSSQMKESKFYRLSLALPLAVPLLVAPLGFLHSRLPLWLIVVLVYTEFSGIIGGVPYLILIAVLLWWSRRKSDAQFKRALALSPVLMLPLVGAMVALALSGEAWFKPENALPLSDGILMFLGLVPFILGFGYLYVVLVFSSASILKRRGLLVPSNAA
jgi:hypothetical protein